MQGKRRDHQCGRRASGCRRPPAGHQLSGGQYTELATLAQQSQRSSAQQSQHGSALELHLRECTSTARGPRPSGCVTVKARESSSREDGSDLARTRVSVQLGLTVRAIPELGWVRCSRMGRTSGSGSTAFTHSLPAPAGRPLVEGPVDPLGQLLPHELGRALAKGSPHAARPAVKDWRQEACAC